MYLNPSCMSSFFMHKTKLFALLFALIMFSLQAKAEEKRHGKLWRVSAAVLGAVTIADVQSSVGRMEANPLLSSQDGRFSNRGVALKGLVVGGALGAQWLLLRKNPNAAPYAAGINFVAAGLTGAAVVHNHMVK
jgi:hypothetical protein